MDNTELFFLIFGLSNHSSVIDTLMIFSAQYLIYLSIILTAVFAFKGAVAERKVLFLILISLPIAVIIIKLIHIFFFESRPFVDQDILPLIFHQADASFPSRHAAIISTIAFAYTFYKSKWAILFLTFLLWVGISRVYVGVHYPLDILGGVAVGFISILIGLTIKNSFKRFFGFNRTDNL